MSDVPWYPSAQFSYVAAAALAIGLADATTIAAHVAGAHRTFQYIPSRVWVVAPLVWVALGMALLVPALPMVRRRAAALVVIALILAGIMARLDRALTPFRGVVAAIVAIVACWSAWRIVRFWVARPRRAAAIVAGAAIVALSVALSLFGREPRGRRPALAASSAAPNVILVFLDTVGYDALFSTPPPNMAQLARESIVFDRAYATAPWTLPSHLSAVTGIPAQSLGVDFDHQRYALSQPTLAEQFRRRGYRTAAVISNPFLNQGSGFERGFDVYEHADNALDLCRTSPGMFADRHWTWFAATVCNWPAITVTRRLLAQMDDDGRPYFLVANYMDAHNPYYVEPRCRAAGFEQPSQSETPPAEYRRRYYPSHLAAIRCIDRDLGAIVKRARQSKRATVLVIAADHGEHFGEKGLVRHGNSVYVQLLHVPLIVNVPWLAPARIGTTLDLTQLPGIVTAAVARAPLPSPRAIATAMLTPPRAISRDADWSVIDGRWHFIVHDRRGEELFDLAADPAENTPLDSGHAPADVARLRAEVQRLRLSESKEGEGRFRSLGYVH